MNFLLILESIKERKCEKSAIPRCGECADVLLNATIKCKMEFNILFIAAEKHRNVGNRSVCYRSFISLVDKSPVAAVDVYETMKMKRCFYCRNLREQTRNILLIDISQIYYAKLNIINNKEQLLEEKEVSLIY